MVKKVTVTIGVRSKGSYAIKLKTIKEILKFLVKLILDISEMTKPKTDVNKTGQIKFVLVDWILMLQMMLQLNLRNTLLDVKILMMLCMRMNVMLDSLDGILLLRLTSDLKKTIAPF